MINIHRVTDFIEKHPVESVSDFRKFYGVSVFDIPEKVTWAEAVLLFEGLANNPESLISAILNDGTKRPWSYSELAIMDLIDITVAANSGKKSRTKRYERPWEGAKKIGKGTVPIEIANHIFGAMGHLDNMKE